MAETGADLGAELAAQVVTLGRALIAAELPLLEANGLGMWDYVILAALRRGVAPTQLELARSTGRDKTRLISNLDGLERANLISRTPDPADRRATKVEITAAGIDVVVACHAAISKMEGELLVDVTADDRHAFLRVLDMLTKTADPLHRTPPESGSRRGAGSNFQDRSQGELSG